MFNLSKSVRGRLAVAAVALAVAAPLAACGSSSSGTTTKAGASGLVPITVLVSTGGTFEPLYIAQSQGFFAKEGLSVTLKPGAQDTSQNVPPILKGEAQFAMTDSSGFLKAAAQSLPVSIVTGLQSSTALTSPSDGLLVKPSSPITSFADLQGKTVAVAALGGTIQFICEYLVKQAGGDPSKVKFVALPLTSLNSAVSSGQVDATYTFASFLSAGKASGLRSIGTGTNELPGLVQALLFASQSYLSANGATAEKFSAAVAEGITYANSHPAAVRAVDTAHTQLPASYIATEPLQIFSPDVNTVVMRTVITSEVAFGLLTSAPADSAIYWDKAPTTTVSH